MIFPLRSSLDFHRMQGHLNNSYAFSVQGTPKLSQEIMNVARVVH